MRIAAIVVAALLVLAFVAERALSSTQTITGQVIDLVCYAQDTANAGNHHGGRGLDCADACIKGEGAPVGIVTSDGKVYQLLGPVVADNNARIIGHVARTVSVTGDVNDSGPLRTITASDLQHAK